MTAQTKFLLDAEDCASLILPLSHLRVAIAGAIGGADFGARHVEYYCQQLPDNDVFGPTRVALGEALAEARSWLTSFRQRLRRPERGRTVLGGELVTLAIVIDDRLTKSETALVAGHIDTLRLYQAGDLAQSAMRLLTGRLEQIAEGYIAEPERNERFPTSAQ